MALPGHYCFQWNDYQTQVRELFGQLLASDTLVDATIVVEGKMITAHRIILSSCSTYFHEMLTSAASAGPATLVLCEESHEDLRSVIEFVYRGELSVPACRVDSVLRLAKDLRITGLMDVEKPLEVTGSCVPQSVTVADDVNDSETAPVEELEEELVEESVEEPAALADDFKGSTEDKARKSRRGPTKRSYNVSALCTALDDLRSGRGLAETAAYRNVPRSTLYFRARALGVTLTARTEHSPQTLDSAVEAVEQGLSLAAASRRFNIPKTVLWRRVQRHISGTDKSHRKLYAIEQRESAVKALEEGGSLTQVSDRFGIPKSTLFREKVRLVASGRLPWSALRRRDGNADGHRQRRLADAVDACKRRRMSQAAAAVAFRVPKTTIWRHMQLSSALETSESIPDYTLGQVDGEGSANDHYDLVKDSAEREDFALDAGRVEQTESDFTLTSEDQGEGCYLENKQDESYSLVEVEEECVEVKDGQNNYSLVEVDPATYIHQSDGSTVIVITSGGITET